MIYFMIISQYAEKCKLFYHYVVWCQGELVVSQEEESKNKTCFSADEVQKNRHYLHKKLLVYC